MVTVFHRDAQLIFHLLLVKPRTRAHTHAHIHTHAHTTSMAGFERVVDSSRLLLHVLKMVLIHASLWDGGAVLTYVLIM